MHFLKWLYPGMRFKRWLFLFAFGVMFLSLGLALIFNYKFLDIIEEEIFRIVYMWQGSYDYMATTVVGAGIVVLGVIVMLFATRMVIRSLIVVLLPPKSGRLVDLIYEKRMLDKGPIITVIGGGHGLAVLLRGIKEGTKNVTAIVTVADDGGSSGRLREDLGIIPPGDIRNCLVALADTEPLMEKLFQYRFGKGELKGHNFGNLFIAAMHEVTGSMDTALKESSKVLAVKGKVIPATSEYIRLDAVMTDGSLVEGESKIPKAHKKIKYVQLYPKRVSPFQEALDALQDADIIVLGPGSLYTSIMPNLLVRGISEAIKKSKALKIYICNVMTEKGETDGYTVSMHVKALLDHAGEGIIDYVLVNSKPLDQKQKARYALEGAYPVLIDEENTIKLGVGLIKADIIDQREGIHHDSVKLAKALLKIQTKLESDKALKRW